MYLLRLRQAATRVRYELRYQLGGIRQITDPNIFRVSPFREMGELRGVVKRFGEDSQRLKDTIIEIQHRLYSN